MKYKLLALVLCFPCPLLAVQFSSAITISELTDKGVHHLQQNTARALAVTNRSLAVVWEDNRTGKAEIYISFKQHQQSAFSAALKVSNNGAAYDPVVSVVGDRYIVMWEKNKYIEACVCREGSCSAAQKISPTEARQASMATDNNGHIYFVWAAQINGIYRLQTGRLVISKDRLTVQAPEFVTPPVKQHQSYPSISVLAAGTSIAYEDREQHHTRLMTVFRPAAKSFIPAQVLNDFVKNHDAKYGAGTGAMRPQLANDKKNHVAVIWLDKRDFVNGYDVYSAMSNNAGKTFSQDEKVQDMLGEGYPQWHANIAMHSKDKLFAAWDDPRDGNMDIWYSVRDKQGWSSDEPVPAASGEGIQAHPALAFDATGRLHMVYVEKRQDGKQKISRLRYVSISF